MDSGAQKPNFFQDFSNEVEDLVTEDKTDEDQKAMSYITHFRGWELLKQKKMRIIEYLDQSLSQAIANGMTREEIGDRALIKEMAKFALNSLVDKFEDARRIEDK